MTKQLETVVFFGNERLATGVTTTNPVLKTLLQTGYQVAAVVSNYQAAQSRKDRSLEIEAVAKDHGIPLLLPRQLLDIKNQLKAYQAQAAVLVAYGRIVPQEVIDIFPRGIINIHPSLLPKHRGSTPIESVMLAGEIQTGTSLMQLTKSMDRGPLYGQSIIKLNGHETKQELADKLLGLGTSMLREQLPSILDGHLRPLPQDDSRASYDSLISKNDGMIDWNKPAVQLEREVRAYARWPGSRTILSGKEVIITSTHVEAKSGRIGEQLVKNKQLLIFTGSDALVIDRLKPVGKPEMSAQDFINGYL
jgi:methionyl-tRNA formyltransferase